MSILDASVVLKWFIEETDTVNANKIRMEFFSGKRNIIVPDLLLYEVSNALRYHPQFTTEEIIESIGTLFDMEIEIITPTRSLLEKAIEIAHSQEVTCYDAVYLALALELDEEFITADEKFLKKLSEPYTSYARLLSDIT